MQVISMTDGKIKKNFTAGKEVIVKQSSFNEIQNIEKARSIFKKHHIVLNGEEFQFHLPKIYDYQNGCIYMEFLLGKNLELSLRNNHTRESAIQTTNCIFQYMFDKQIYWGDFAPRNIMIDEDNKKINLCDFERGIKLNISNKEYLQNYVYEEYAAFLLPPERNFSETMNHIFTVNEVYPISFDEIKSNRVKSIIIETGLPMDKLTNQTVANVNKMIILAETPYKQNGIPVFPIIELEETKDRSYRLFAQKVCQIINNRGISNGKNGRL